MNTIIEALQIPIILHAFIAMLVAGSTLSLVGVIIIPLHLMTMRFTLMHVGLFGAAIALALNLSPTLFAYLFVVTISFVMGLITRDKKEKASSVGAIFMTGSLAGAFVLLAATNVPAMEVFDIFAGNILMMNRVDLFLTIILGAIVILFFSIMRREIQLILLNPELAHVLGVPVKMVMNIIFIILGFSVATALKLVGALLVDALLFLPAVASLRISRNFHQAITFTSLFGFLTALSGFLIALFFSLPIGASSALSATVIVMGVYITAHVAKI